MSNETKAPSARISHTARIMLTLAVILVLSSCAHLNSIYRQNDFGNNARIVSVDAKQRFLVGMDIDDDNNKLKRLCAEPSPDVFSAFAASLSGEAKFKAFEAALNASSSENAATIGIRTQAIQLLRDGMYRICEGLMNGDLEKKHFLDLHRRYQRIMVTLVAIEQLTGAVRPPSVAIQTSALAGRPANLNVLQDDLEKAREKVAENEAIKAEKGAELSSKNGDDGKKKACKDLNDDEPAEANGCKEYATAIENLNSSKENVKALKKDIEAARSELVNQASGTVTLVDNRSSGLKLDADSVDKISAAVKEMVASMFRLDPDTAVSKFAEFKCLVYLREAPIIEQMKYDLRLAKAQSNGSTDIPINELSSSSSANFQSNLSSSAVTKSALISYAQNTLERSIERIRAAEGDSLTDIPSVEIEKQANTTANICEALVISINPDTIKDR